MRRSLTRAALIGLSLVLAGRVSAEPAPAANPVAASPVAAGPGAVGASAVPGWTAFLDGLRDLPDRILARLPKEQQDDPQVRAEVGRLALSSVAAATIGALASDPDHPVFLPQLNNYLTIGQPNADTNYRSAIIAPGGTFRLRGRRGSMSQAWIMESALPPQRPKPGARPVHDLNALRVDGQGRYDVILSPVRPAGYAGDWWPLDPATNSLLVRMVAADWSREREPTLSIERLDAPAERPRPSAPSHEARLRGIPTQAAFSALVLVDRPQKLRADGFVNRFRGVDMSTIGGLAGQFYYEGAYDLGDDEALVIETPVPKRCPYYSLILTNQIYETTDWYNNHSSLNGAQAHLGKDRVLRVVVSARDPGVPNWLDTAGYPSGVIQGRWMNCSAQPVPSVRKLALSAVRAALPSDTPAVSPKQREATVRERRSVLQQRPLW